MTVFRMIGNGEVPNATYLSRRSAVRWKYERAIEGLASLAEVETIVISAGSRAQDTIYAVDGGRWLKAIDLIEHLVARAIEHHRKTGC